MYWVTGATGLVGKYMVKALLVRGNRVLAFYHTTPFAETEIWLKEQGISDEQMKALTWMSAADWDFQDPEQELSALIHCAAMVSYHRKDHAAMMEVNVHQTERWVNWCLDHQVPMGYVSSIAALGKAAEGKKIDEECFWQPSKDHTEYARTKFLGEMEVWRGHEEGGQFVIVNPGVIIGDCSPKQSTGALFETVARNWRGYPQGGTGWVSAQDVANAMLALLENSKWGQRYVLVAENQTMQWAFGQIAKSMGLKTPFWKVNGVVLKLLWMLDGFKEKFMGIKAKITEEAIRNTGQVKEFSSEKINRELGFQFENMEEVFSKTGTYMLRHLHL
jgi:nucleoside-diphosphate-sugar epimerase